MSDVPARISPAMRDSRRCMSQARISPAMRASRRYLCAREDPASQTRRCAETLSQIRERSRPFSPGQVHPTASSKLPSGRPVKILPASLPPEVPHTVPIRNTRRQHSAWKQNPCRSRTDENPKAPGQVHPTASSKLPRRRLVNRFPCALHVGGAPPDPFQEPTAPSARAGVSGAQSRSTTPRARPPPAHRGPLQRRRPSPINVTAIGVPARISLSMRDFCLCMSQPAPRRVETLSQTGEHNRPLSPGQDLASHARLLPVREPAGPKGAMKPWAKSRSALPPSSLGQVHPTASSKLSSARCVKTLPAPLPPEVPHTVPI